MRSWSAACPTSSATPTAVPSTRPRPSGSSPSAGPSRSRSGPAGAAASPPPDSGGRRHRGPRRGRPLTKSTRDMSGPTRAAPTNEATFPAARVGPLMSRVDLVRGLPRLGPRCRRPPLSGGGLAAAPAGPDLERDGPALGDDPLGRGRVDGTAVGVADDVGHAADQDRMQPFGQVGSDDAAGLEVLGAALDHLGVVDLRELRVGPAGVVRGPD